MVGTASKCSSTCSRSLVCQHERAPMVPVARVVLRRCSVAQFPECTCTSRVTLVPGRARVDLVPVPHSISRAQTRLIVRINVEQPRVPETVVGDCHPVLVFACPVRTCLSNDVDLFPPAGPSDRRCQTQHALCNMTHMPTPLWLSQTPVPPDIVLHHTCTMYPRRHATP